MRTTLFAILIALILTCSIGCAGIFTPNVTAISLFKDHGLEGGKLEYDAATKSFKVELNGYQSNAQAQAVAALLKIATGGKFNLSP